MQPIVIDLETIAIDDAATYLVEPVEAPSNWKDPVKIAAYIAEEKARQLDKAALDIDLAQIICIGLKVDTQPSRVMTAEHFSEADMLEEVWTIFRHYVKTGNPMLITFNGLWFDIPMLLRRSLYLDIKAPYIQTDRFKHPQVHDLMVHLSKDQKSFRGLQFYLNRLGYKGSEPDVTGKDIRELHAKGDWVAIANHCQQDVDGTAWLAERIGAVPKPQQGMRPLPPVHEQTPFQRRMAELSGGPL